MKVEHRAHPIRAGAVHQHRVIDRIGQCRREFSELIGSDGGASDRNVDVVHSQRTNLYTFLIAALIRTPEVQNCSIAQVAEGLKVSDARLWPDSERQAER